MKKSILLALLAAALFGVGTPFAKLLLRDMSPAMLAGVFYLASGTGLFAWIAIRRLMPGSARRPGSAWTPAEAAWLAAAIVSGGIVGPVLLLQGLVTTPASTAALLLNMEGVLTALIAWFAFKENFDRRIVVGMTCIMLGGALLAWPEHRTGFRLQWGSLAVIGACLCWAIDNNLTRKVSHRDPAVVAGFKGLIAGAVNVSIAVLITAQRPTWTHAAAAAVVGFASYGLSLVLFVLALRQLGAARTAAYFSTAPFLGAVLSLAIFKQVPGPLYWLAAALMGTGVWLHLAERHAHEHVHERMRHEHSHIHDEHHQHEHNFEWDGKEPHTHEHEHQHLVHSHAHYPDIHHRHSH